MNTIICDLDYREIITVFEVTKRDAVSGIDLMSSQTVTDTNR